MIIFVVKNKPGLSIERWGILMNNFELSLEASQKTGIWIAPACEQNHNSQKRVNIISEPEWLSALKKLIYGIIQ